MNADETKTCPLCGGRVFWFPISNYWGCEHCKNTFNRYTVFPDEVKKTSAVGNAAAMREALELCVKEMCNYCRNEAIARGLELTCVDGCEAYKIAQAALSAPARNCDLYASATEALKAQDVAFNEDNFKNGECKLGCPGCDDGLIDCKILWLFAPAEKRKGESDGR